MEKEIVELLEKLQRAAVKAGDGDTSEKERCLDILRQMKKMNMTTSVLASTQAGKRVRSLVKHRDVEISGLAKEVVGEWKSMVQRSMSGVSSSVMTAGTVMAGTATDVGGGVETDEKRNTTGGKGMQEEVATSDVSNVVLTPSTASSKGRQENSVPQKHNDGSQKTGELDASHMTGDRVRDTIRRNLMTALDKVRKEGVTEGDAVMLACAIELAMFEGMDGVSAKYKGKFRQLHFNIKDDANPDLRRKIMQGEIEPSELIHLSPEELASDAKKEENQRIREKKLFDAAPSSVKQATTDQFQCGKCRQRKCTYYQMQTRSADEPMTTFVRCTVCNNSWKFS